MGVQHGGVGIKISDVRLEVFMGMKTQVGCLLGCDTI